MAISIRIRGAGRTADRRVAFGAPKANTIIEFELQNDAKDANGELCDACEGWTTSFHWAGMRFPVALVRSFIPSHRLRILCSADDFHRSAWRERADGAAWGAGDRQPRRQF